jgi:hypothetical protein
MLYFIILVDNSLRVLCKILSFEEKIVLHKKARCKPSFRRLQRAIE